MKQLTFFLFSSLLFIACNSGSSTTSADTTAANSDSSNGSDVSYPYAISYSSDFSIGDPKHAQTVLAIWKDYDNNTYDAYKAAFADSLMVITYSGVVVAGSRDSVINAIASYRATLASVKETVDAIVSLQPKGKEESWVSVWGKEIDTHKDNKVDSMGLHEDFMFDKNGKVVWMQQHVQTLPKNM